MRVSFLVSWGQSSRFKQQQHQERHYSQPKWFLAFDGSPFLETALSTTIGYHTSTKQFGARTVPHSSSTFFSNNNNNNNNQTIWCWNISLAFDGSPFLETAFSTTIGYRTSTEQFGARTVPHNFFQQQQQQSNNLVVEYLVGVNFCLWSVSEGGEETLKLRKTTILKKRNDFQILVCWSIQFFDFLYIK